MNKDRAYFAGKEDLLNDHLENRRYFAKLL